MMFIESAIAVCVAYLFGSLSSAIIVCRVAGLPDPRTQGSQNPGATNVLRIGGKLPAFITLFGDAVKGVIPILMARALGFDTNILALVALAAFIGHLYPIFFGFKGGKGVATLIGCLLALSLPTGACWLLTWLVVAILFRYSSLAALTASMLAPVYMWYFSANDFYVAATLVMVGLVFIRHRGNIKKLLAGTENKIGKK